MMSEYPKPLLLIQAAVAALGIQITLILIPRNDWIVYKRADWTKNGVGLMVSPALALLGMEWSSLTWPPVQQLPSMRDYIIYVLLRLMGSQESENPAAKQIL